MAAESVLLRAELQKYHVTAHKPPVRRRPTGARPDVRRSIADQVRDYLDWIKTTPTRYLTINLSTL
jgi:hypothetical protein